MRPARNGEIGPPGLAVTLLSAAALGYEVLLTRLLSIVQWHHFAYMVISVALLGYGAAGTFVSLFRDQLLPRFSTLFAAAAALFALTAVAGVALAQRVPFNPLELVWDVRQPGHLLLLYLSLLPPFFFAATALCLTFVRFGAEVHRVYAFDILGAGLGGLGLLGVLFMLPTADALRVVAAVGLLAGAVSLRHTVARASLLVAAVVLPAALPASWVRLVPSPYKDLSQALAIEGAEVVAERSSPLGQLTVVDSPRVPLRHAPGLSLATVAEPPPQLGLYTDGDGPMALIRFDGALAPLAYLDGLTAALPYHLRPRPHVLVLGAGAGGDVLQALSQGAAHVDAVELNPQVVELVQERFGDFTGRPYRAPNVHLHVAEARGYVSGSDARYDVIQIALLDTFGAASAGLYALSENYLYTIEALQAGLRRLSPGGLLAITRWVTLPPKDTLKLFATAVRALEAEGVERPGRRLVLVRGWKTATLLVKNGDFTNDELAAVAAFCRERSFDTEWMPGLEAGGANRYNVIEPSAFFEGARALLGPDRAAFSDAYPFDLEPATDDRPYFFHFFKWRTLPSVLERPEGMALFDWGYPILLATLLQVAAVALVLVLLPLVVRARSPSPRGLRRRIAVYFLALGFGFMFIEMAFIQKFILFLSHPLYAVAVVLSAFLFFAGLGSRVSGTFARAPRWWPFLSIVGLALLSVPGLPPLFAAAATASDAVRIGLSVGLIAPLAFFMGMPFPLGLAGVSAAAAPLLPWAWAINGFASVVAAILATVLAIHLGFDAVLLLASALYGLAAVVAPLGRTPTRG